MSDFWQGIYAKDSVLHVPASGICTSAVEIYTALCNMGALKALPPHYAPTVLWQHNADKLSRKVAESLMEQWKERILIPREWTRAWIHFLPKSPAELRPIGLLDPMGKAVIMVLKARVHPRVTEAMSSTPQFAYLDHRSTHQALLKVFAHCERGRQLSRAQKPNLIARFDGATVRDCANAFQISLDFAKAFDSLDGS